MADKRFDPAAPNTNAIWIAEVDNTGNPVALGTTFTVSKTGTHLVTHISYKPYVGGDEVTVAVAGTPTVSALTVANIVTAIGTDALSNDNGFVKTFATGTLTITNTGSLLITSVTTTTPS